MPLFQGLLHDYFHYGNMDARDGSTSPALQASFWIQVQEGAMNLTLIPHTWRFFIVHIMRNNCVRYGSVNFVSFLEVVFWLRLIIFFKWSMQIEIYHPAVAYHCFFTRCKLRHHWRLHDDIRSVPDRGSKGLVMAACRLLSILVGHWNEAHDLHPRV
jgi:hypothetical protein